MLSLQLFGRPQIKIDNKEIELPRRKSRALIYYLAAHSQPLTRDQLLPIFWMDLDRAAALQSLRTTLHGLRKALGDSLIIEEDRLSFSGDTVIDTRLFDSDSKLPSSLLALYQGDFLDGFSLPDAPAFEDWVSVQREHYQRMAVRGFTALAKQQESEKKYSEALETLARALAFDPLQEDLQRDAIRLHYLAGDRAGAIRRYDTLRKLLDEEMGVPPMAETRAVYDAIITDKLLVESKELIVKTPPSTVNHPLSTALPFTGRANELQTLRESAARVDRSLILIEGEAGIGKTRLVEEFIREAKALVLIGSARELEQTIPYQPIIEAIRSLPATHCETIATSIPAVWRKELARLLPELFSETTQATASTLVDESRLWESINQFFSTLAKTQTVILFIDDLHWADQSTLALLGYLTHQTTAPLTLIATTRLAAPRSALGTLIQSLTRENRLLRLTPSRFSTEDITSVASRLSAQFVYPLAEWLSRLSEGNPYVLAELVREAHEQEVLRADGVVNLNALSQNLVPQTIYSLIVSRLGRLSETARRVLDAAVAVGREFDFEIVSRAAALSEIAALDALDELRAASFVFPRKDDVTGKFYIFDHTLSMEVAYREVGEMRHRLLHRRAAEALEVVHRDHLDSFAGLIASHFIEGNAADRAAPYALLAAQHATSLAAWKEAIAFYEQALNAIDDKRKRIEIFIGIGSAQMNGGNVIQASEAFRSALTLSHNIRDVAHESTARLLLSRSLLLQGRFVESIELAQQARSTNLVDAEMIWGIALSLEGADLLGAEEHLQKAEALCDEHQPPSMLAQIRFERGSVAAQQGDLLRAVELYKNALATAEQDREGVVQQILALNNIAYHLHLLNDPQAISYAKRGLQLAQETGALYQQTYLLSTLGEITLANNDVTGAEKLFSEGLLIAEQILIPERIAGLTANLGRVAAARGETSLAVHRFSTAIARADSLRLNHLAAQIRLWLAPLLPRDEARLRLLEAKTIAESGGRKKLLEEIQKIEKTTKN